MFHRAKEQRGGHLFEWHCQLRYLLADSDLYNTRLNEIRAGVPTPPFTCSEWSLLGDLPSPTKQGPPSRRKSGGHINGWMQKENHSVGHYRDARTCQSLPVANNLLSTDQVLCIANVVAENGGNVSNQTCQPIR